MSKESYRHALRLVEVLLMSSPQAVFSRDTLHHPTPNDIAEEIALLTDAIIQELDKLESQYQAEKTK